MYFFLCFSYVNLYTEMLRSAFSTTFCIFIQTVMIAAKPPDFIPQEMMDMVAGDKARCMEEHGTTEDMIDKVNTGELSNDRKLTCYMFCLFDAFSLVDEDGNIEIELLMSILPDTLSSVAAEIIPACTGKGGADICEVMYNTAKCIQQKKPDLFFML